MEKQEQGRVKHKAEVARHFPRYRIPAYLEIDGKKYKVRDWSLGGCAVEGLEDEIYEKGWVKGNFIIPFDTFDVSVKDINLEFVRKGPDGVVGCRFSELNPDQIALLQDVIEAYLDGSIITLDEFINVIKREDLKEALEKRRPKPKKTLFIADMLRKLFVFTLFIIILTFLIIFILKSLYIRVFTVEPVSSYYDADLVVVRTPERGFFTSYKKLKTGDVVHKNDILGFIETPFLGSFNVISPVDGRIVDNFTANMKGVKIGDPLFTILPNGRNIHIKAFIPNKDVDKVYIGQNVEIIDSTGKLYKGIIKEISVEHILPSVLVGGPLQQSVEYSSVKIELKEGEVPLEKIGKSVWVRIDLSPPYLKPVFRYLDRGLEWDHLKN